jgi:hypothetical protein
LNNSPNILILIKNISNNALTINGSIEGLSGVVTNNHSAITIPIGSFLLVSIRKIGTVHIIFKAELFY